MTVDSDRQNGNFCNLNLKLLLVSLPRPIEVTQDLLEYDAVRLPRTSVLSQSKVTLSRPLIKLGGGQNTLATVVPTHPLMT
jgi:hypothetical protein